MNKNSIRFLAIALVLFIPLTALAVPPMMNLQGRLLTESGTPAQDGSYAITFIIWDDQTATGPSNEVWRETMVGISIVNGLFNVVFGLDTGSNPLTMDMFRDNSQLWLGIKIEAGPGVPVGGEPELPRQRLLTVAYAFGAAYSEEALFAYSSLDLSCTNCVSEAELDFNPVTDAELAAALAALPIPTSVDGMSGGNITSAVTINGNEVCDISGNCSPSSRRFKENIKPLKGALDKVMKLKGVSYTWKKDGRKDIGLIAEEVGKVIPEIVRYEDNGVDARSVDYPHLTAMLVEAVKTQQKQINELKQALDQPRNPSLASTSTESLAVLIGLPLVVGMAFMAGRRRKK
jgi:endosialidase-like protein